MSSETDMTLPKISSGASLMPTWLPSDFDIFSTPSRPTRRGVVITHCGRQAVAPHQLAADEEVEELVGAAELDVGLEGDGVVPLAERVEELVDGDRLARLVALGEVVALEELGDGVAPGEADEPVGAEGAEPAGVEVDDGRLRVEDLEDLRLVGLGVGEDLVAASAAAASSSSRSGRR